MAKSSIKVNSAELIKFTNKLEKIGKKAVPIAIQNTLNSMAFDVKGKTLEKEANKAFTRRNKTFFKKFSRVEKATGTNIKTMKATVGMVDASRSGRREQAGADMTPQQKGGVIGGRTLIPHDEARVSGNNKKNVRAKNRVKDIKVNLNTADSRATDIKQRFIQTAITAVERFGDGAIIQHKNEKGKEFIFRVQKGGSDIKTRKFNIKVTPLYSVVDGRVVRVKGKPFTLRAARQSQKKGNEFYKKHAQKQIKRFIK